MRGFLLRIMPFVRITRVSKGFAAAGNLWFVVLWTRAQPDEAARAADLPVVTRDLWILLAGGGLAGAGLYAFGAILNDMLDINRDRALRPDRPIAAGTVSPHLGAVGVAGALIAAVLGATAFGTGGVLITLALAGGVLLFNSAGKFIPALGLMLLCLIYAVHTLTPNPGMRFLWPVWLIMTHAGLVGAITHALERKSPPITGRAVAVATTGWAVLTAVLLAIGAGRAGGGGDSGWWPDWITPWAPIAPALLAVLFAGMVVRRIRAIGPGPRAAEKIGRYGALWLPMYGAGWLLGVGEVAGALLLAGLVLAAVLGMTILREAYGLAEQPIGYRRA